MCEVGIFYSHLITIFSNDAIDDFITPIIATSFHFLVATYKFRSLFCALLRPNLEKKLFREKVRSYKYSGLNIDDN